jgi:hypothetical protein
LERDLAPRTQHITQSVSAKRGVLKRQRPPYLPLALPLLDRERAAQAQHCLDHLSSVGLHLCNGQVQLSVDDRE